MRTTEKLLLGSLVALWLAPWAMADPITYTDGFEGASLSSFWTPLGPGSATLTTAAAHSGSQSLYIATSSTYPWYLDLFHDFGSEQTGSVSVYVKSGLLCCGSAADLEADETGLYSGAFASIQRTTDIGFVGRPAPPGSPEIPGIVPGIPLSATGWDHLELDINASGTTMMINGVVFYTNPLVTEFQYVSLDVWGSPGDSEYYDDFSATTQDGESSVPEPQTLSLVGSILLGFSTMRRMATKRNG